MKNNKAQSEVISVTLLIAIFTIFAVLLWVLGSPFISSVYDQGKRTVIEQETETISSSIYDVTFDASDARRVRTTPVTQIFYEENPTLSISIGSNEVYNDSIGKIKVDADIPLVSNYEGGNYWMVNSNNRNASVRMQSMRLSADRGTFSVSIIDMDSNEVNFPGSVKISRDQSPEFNNYDVSNDNITVSVQGENYKLWKEVINDKVDYNTTTSFDNSSNTVEVEIHNDGSINNAHITTNHLLLE